MRHPHGLRAAAAAVVSGSDIAVAHFTSPFISVYPWSSGFGAKYADPATLVAGLANGVAFNPL